MKNLTGLYIYMLIRRLKKYCTYRVDAHSFGMKQVMER